MDKKAGEPAVQKGACSADKEIEVQVMGYFRGLEAKGRYEEKHSDIEGGMHAHLGDLLMGSRSGFIEKIRMGM